MFALFALLLPQPVAADRPRLRIIPNSELRFGTFAVIDRGYRIVSPGGTVQSSGIFSITSGDTSPARFTVRYNRGNNGRRRLNLRIQLVITQPPPVTQGGITAKLSGLQTDLPGAANVQPGEVIEITIPNCRTRICRKSFNIGGRLDIENDYGGGKVEIPIFADVVLISVR